MDASAAGTATGTGTGHGNGGECQVCGDAIERDSQGRFFVACHHCGFPVCRPCYDFECKDGSHCCPHCNTRYPDPQDRDEDDFHHHRNYDYEHRADDPANASVQGERPSQQLALSLPPDPADHEIEEASVHRLARSCASVTGMAVGMADTMSNAAWKERVESWKAKHPNERPGIPELDDLELDDIMMAEAEARQPLWRKVPIPSSKMNPYRIVIVLRLIILGFFFNYRLTNPPTDAIGLWLVSVICEIWFALSWILDQFPKWSPVTRETYLDTLAMRYEREGEPCKLAGIDVFVSTVDPLKEPPLITANTVLSVVAMDYPVDRVACYVSDDGASMLTFDAMNETSEFARKWVPFCKKYAIEPRAPEFYFSQKIDYLKDKVHPTFVKDRRAMKREYEEFKVKINGMVSKAQKKPEEGWVMQDGTPWPGNNTRDHPGMIQVFLGNGGARDTEGNELPRVVYVSREKRPGHQHHKKAGAMNALIRVSAVLTNAAFMLNLDCDHYINNSKAVREAMCFLMDPQLGKKLCYVQFPQRFDGIDPNDRYANRNTVFFDINMKGLDGLQGPVYVGTGCVFNRQALYGYEPTVTEKRPKLTCDCWPSWCCCCCCCGGSRKKAGSKKSKGRSLASRLLGRKKKSKAPDVAAIPLFKLEEIEEGLEGYEEHDKSWLMSQKNFEKRFGLSPVFIASTLMENGGLPESASSVSLIKEAIHVISCGYEEKTEWGKEVGWIYGSVTEDILTGFKMHCRGWKSVYCMPALAAFKGSAPINLSDRLHQVLRWALGSIEIFMSRHCPLWYAWGSGSSTNTENSNRSKLKLLQRMAYINTVVYPFTSIPLLAYCTLPAVCLLTGKFITPTLTGIASIWFLCMFLAIIFTSVLELRWSGVSMSEFWRNEQFWVIAGVSAHLFAVVQGLLKVLGGVDTNFTVTAKAAADDEDEFADLYMFKWTTLLIPPTTLVIMNLVALVAGVSAAINNNYQSWGPLFGKVFFAVWVVLHLYPFLKGLMGRHNRTPTIVVMWSILLASIFSLIWLRIDPFLPKNTGPILQQCGIDC